MKCPECGFECLPDDIECLACGVDIASAKKNKEKELVRSKEAIERQKQYEIELKKELGLISEADAASKTKKVGKTLEETFKQVPKCPKCGFNRVEGVTDCPRCGIVYDKVKFAGNSAATTSVHGSNGNGASAPEPKQSVAPPPEPTPSVPSTPPKSEIPGDAPVELPVAIDDIDIDDLRLESDEEKVSLMDVEPIYDEFEGSEEKTDEIDISAFKRNARQASLAVETPSTGEEPEQDSKEDVSADNETGDSSAVVADTESTPEPQNDAETVEDLDEDEEEIVDIATLEDQPEPTANQEDQPVVSDDGPPVEASASEATISTEDNNGSEVVDDDQESEIVLAGKVHSPITSDSGDDEEIPVQTENGTDVNGSLSEPLPITPEVADGETDFESEETLVGAPVEPVEPRVIEAEGLLDDEDNEKTEIISLEKHGMYQVPSTTPVSPETGDDSGEVGASGKRGGAALASVAGKLGPVLKPWLENLSNTRRSTKIIAGSVVGLILFLSIMLPVGMNYYENYKIEKKRQAYLEQLERIRVSFLNNKDEIIRDIKLKINDKRFDDAQKDIDSYDIESLQTELVPIKNYLKEIKLYEVVKKIPANQYAENYNMFIELLSLNPESKLYSTKRDYYRKKYASSEYDEAATYLKLKKKNVSDLTASLDAIETAITLEPGTAKYLKLKKRLLTEKLLFYEGNSNLVMAVKDEGMGKRLYSGQRKLTIWLKNVSSEETYINVKYFTMVGKDNREYTYNDIGRPFKGKLLPGEQTRGELYFRTRSKPSRIIFSHLTNGEISREFP